MDKIMTTHDYVKMIRYFIAISHDTQFSVLARRVLAEHADAMIKSYRVDDYRAVLVEVVR
jgi:hypothetical protein